MQAASQRKEVRVSDVLASTPVAPPDIPDLVAAVEADALADIRSLVERIAASHLDDLTAALERLKPAPGAVELLCYFRENAAHLTALLGEGGDPAFVEKIKDVCADAVCGRALDGIDARAVGPFFDYYLTFAVSAEAGVLRRPVRQDHRPQRAGLRAGAHAFDRIADCRGGRGYPPCGRRAQP